MKIKIKNLFVLMAGILLIAAASLGIVWFINQNTPKDDSFLIQLQNIDGLMGQGYFLQAREDLLEIISKTKKDSQWLRVLKRGYYISEYLEDPQFLYELSRTAGKRAKEEEKILPFLIYSANRTGRFSQSIDLAETLKDPRWSSLKSLTFLYEDPLKAADFTADEEIAGLLRSQITDSYEKIRLAAENTGDNRLWLDSALLSALQGNRENTLDNINKMTEKEPYAEILSRLYWDLDDLALSGFYLNQALLRYPSRLDLLQMRGDLALVQGDRPTAETIYQDLIQKEPNRSWVPYYNLGLLYQQQNQLQRGIEILEEGYDYFPQNPEIYLFLIELLAFTEQHMEARLLMEEHRDNTEVALLEVKWYPTMESPRKRTARLWDLYNEDQTKEGVAQYLIWNSLSLGDLEGGRLALDIAEKRLGFNWWIGFYSGVAALLEGNYPQAIEDLNSSLEGQENFATLMNLSILLQNQERWRESFPLLNRALQIAESQNRSNAVLSKIHTLVGKYYASQAEYSKAKLEYALAQELDQSNIEVQMLYDQL